MKSWASRRSSPPSRLPLRLPLTLSSAGTACQALTPTCSRRRLYSTSGSPSLRGRISAFRSRKRPCGARLARISAACGGRGARARVSAANGARLRRSACRLQYGCSPMCWRSCSWPGLSRSSPKLPASSSTSRRQPCASRSKWAVSARSANSAGGRAACARVSRGACRRATARCAWPPAQSSQTSPPACRRGSCQSAGRRCASQGAQSLCGRLRYSCALAARQSSGCRRVCSCQLSGWPSGSNRRPSRRWAAFRLSRVRPT
ncbi:hypothetical protein D3C78_1023430 [compost metagenome]